MTVMERVSIEGTGQSRRSCATSRQVSPHSILHEGASCAGRPGGQDQDFWRRRPNVAVVGDGTIRAVRCGDMSRAFRW